ncbi:hypothetical protein BC834DRAFT_970908 [Gloeopeniophorella convolvens]|nr:hypothetical protein BC834DRAFT_970908 [Gloeopeniophorella convolvens]
MAIQEVTTAEAFRAVISQHQVVVIFFTVGPWGRVRTRIMTFLEGLSEDSNYSGVTFVFANTKDYPNVATEAGIQEAPMFVTYKNGRTYDQLLRVDEVQLLTLIHETMEA